MAGSLINSRFLLTLNLEALRRRSLLAVGERFTGVSTPFEDEISDGAVAEVGEKGEDVTVEDRFWPAAVWPAAGAEPALLLKDRFIWPIPVPAVISLEYRL